MGPMWNGLAGLPVASRIGLHPGMVATQRIVPAVMEAPMVTATQYHSQDELGQASFGYSHPGQSATNFRDANGNQVGSYAYINAVGKEVRVSYVADALGFRVVSNDLPIGPTGPVAVAPVANMMMPMPVMETPEVSAARAAHMAAHAAALSL